MVLDAIDRGGLRVEPDLAAIVEPPLDQVFDDLLLAVDGDTPAGQCAEIDPVLLALKAQLDAVVDQAFASHSVADAGRAQEVSRSLFEHAGAHARLDVVPAAGLEHDGLAALRVPAGVRCSRLRRPSLASRMRRMRPRAVSRFSTSAAVDRSSETRSPSVRWSISCSARSA